MESRTPIIPEDLTDDVEVEMSGWELHNFAIQIVRDHIVNNIKGNVLSYCDVDGIDPQVWFEDKQGTRSWVVDDDLLLFVATSIKSEV